MTPICPEHYSALGAFVAYALRVPTQVEAAKAFVEILYGEEGIASYEDLSIGEEDLPLARSMAKEAGVKTSGIAYRQLRLALQLVTKNTPICEDCGKLAIINEAGWKIVENTNCPHCNGLVKAMTVETTRRCWIDGAEVPISEEFNRDFVPHIPRTDEGIRGFLRVELGLVPSTLFTGSLSRIANILSCHQQFIQLFSGPTQVLRAIGDPRAAGLTSSQIRRIGQILNEDKWYQKTKNITQAASTIPATGTLPKIAIKLPHETILELFSAANSLGLDRNVLISGIHVGFAGGINRAGSPGAQHLMDLSEFNRVGILSDGSYPLYQWLKAAIALSTLRPESQIFKTTLNLLESKTPKSSQKWGSFPHIEKCMRASFNTSNLKMHLTWQFEHLEDPSNMISDRASLTEACHTLVTYYHKNGCLDQAIEILGAENPAFLKRLRGELTY